jgi:YhcH/YjgK/YiaL family protein
MIHDLLSRADSYCILNSQLAKALRFLQDHDLATLPLGRHELDGDNVYIRVDEYTTRPHNEAHYENHRHYVDVQCVGAGSERVVVGDVGDMMTCINYDAERDIEFHKGAAAKSVLLVPGMFLILFPHEAHQPSVHPADRPVDVHKVVAKVRLYT